MASEWFILGNPTKYDVVSAFKELDKIDWKQSTNIVVEDIVYLYVSQGYQAVKYKCKVNKVDLPKPEIDDKKFDVTGEFDGTYGRYMELELIKELKGDLYSKKVMESHGFQSPQIPVRVIPQMKEYLELIQLLQDSNELDPDQHDGSYELVRETINAYSKMSDLSQIDYKDLNLVYLMSVGTWKQKVPAKKNTINDSHLPDTEKQRLTEVLDAVWAKAENGEYENQESGKASIGMFGTGFFTFQGKTDDASPRNFIQMCIDIKDMQDDDEIFNRCEKTLNDKFHGMKAASASMVLHCLKPMTFPIFNSNMGADSIYVYLGTDIKWKTEIYTYIKNSRIVKKFRDDNFTIKNYRIFDMAAWNIGKAKNHTSIDYLGVMDYLDNNREVPYSNPETLGLDDKEKARLLEVKTKGQNAVAEMKKMAELCKEKFKLDKCEPMAWLDGSNTKTRRYLWAQLKYSDYGSRPESISLFVDMSDATNKPRYRFSLELKNDGSDKAVVSNYHSYLDMPLEAESSLVYMAGSNEYGHPTILEEDRDTIKAQIADGTYKKVQLCRVVDYEEELTNDDIEQAMLEGVQELIPYYEHVLGIEKIEYWPSQEEYPVNLTKDDWKKFIEEIEYPSHKGCMRVLKCFLDIGGIASPKVLSDKYKGHPTVYTSSVYNTSRRALEFFNMEPCPDGDMYRYFPIAFFGRSGGDENNGNYVYKMRDELLEALQEIDLSEIDIQYKKGGEDGMNGAEFDKNMILYGPPGTGKTYNTAIYAVAICDGRSLSEVEAMPYEQVLERYKELKDKEKRVAFITFHQSYGYEEFIEGIKPKMDSGSNDIEYTIKDGVFKSFCDRACQKKAETDVIKTKDGARVWNVILGGSDSPGLKQKCFDEGTIRIGWHMAPEIITEDTENLNDKEKRILLNFQDEMEIGDVVVVRSTASSVDGIGIISGDAVFDTTIEKYPRKRTVDWICKETEIEIIDLNGGTRLDRKSVYELSRVSANDILSRIPANSGINVEEENRPYVFIIDEINRGNISKIFGELITLIEPTKRKGAAEEMEAVLPYSNKPFGVPNNVYIIGTMNTADRSIALMDTALRRRFQFIEKMPDADVLRKIGADKVSEAGVDLDVANMLEKINTRIEYLFDREHTIGHAFFTGLKDEPTVEKLASIFRKSVIPLLQEYFYEDYSKIMLVLGDNEKDQDENKQDDNKFILTTEIKANNIFKGDTSDIDIPDYSYKIQDEAFYNIKSYVKIAD